MWHPETAAECGIQSLLSFEWHQEEVSHIELPPPHCYHVEKYWWRTVGLRDRQRPAEAHSMTAFSLNFSILWAYIVPYCLSQFELTFPVVFATRKTMIHDTDLTGNKHTSTQQPQTLATNFHISGTHTCPTKLSEI